MPFDLEAHFGPIDIYLFDQLLRGQIAPGMRVLDAGCGSGRNLIYLLKAGYDITAVDADAGAVAAVRRLAAEITPEFPPDRIRQEPLESLSFPDASFDVVICSAVLHFARDDAQFEAMVRGMWRVLKPGGIFFARLASNIGMEGRMRHLGNHRYLLPDGTERYLVDEGRLVDLTRALGGVMLDPLKTTIVQDQRCMTTWVVRKLASKTQP